MRWKCALVIAVVASAGIAQAAGYYNLPTSLPQCLGVGFGPGHHAPLLLGPCWKAGTTAQRVKRLPAPLSPPPAYDFGGPSLWGSEPQNAYAPGAFTQGPFTQGIAAPPLAESYFPNEPTSAPMLSAPMTPASARGSEVIPTPRPVAD